MDLGDIFTRLTPLLNIEDEKIRVTHDIDPQTGWATIQLAAEFPVGRSLTLFKSGLVAVEIHPAQLWVTASLDAGLAGAVHRRTSAIIGGACQIVVGGVPLVTLNDTKLRFEDGISISVSPENVQLQESARDARASGFQSATGPLGGGY